MVSAEAAKEEQRNWLDRIASVLDKVGIFNKWTKIVAAGVLFVMVSLNFVNVFMRYLFNRAILGAEDVVGILMILAVFLAIACTQDEKRHVAMDLIPDFLRPKPQLILKFFTNLISLGLFSILVWRAVVLTISYATEHRIESEYLHIPSAPFAAIIVLGCATLGLMLVRDLLRMVSQALKLGLKWYHWLLMFGLPIIFLVLAILWMQPTLWQINLIAVGVIGAIFSLLLLLTGMPVSYALILTGLLFIGHIRGSFTAFDMVGLSMFRVPANYTWAVVNFFVLMGYLVFHSKFGEDMYYAAYRWIGRLRGGLSMATIAASAAMSATVGDNVSVTATMTTIALPQMRKYKYSDYLSAGTLCAGGTLGPIIPPSVLFIIYGLVVPGMSIGKLFVGGIFPGLLLAFLFCITIYVWCRINPKIGPAGGERFKWGERLVSLKAGGPVLILFLLVIGGLYVGIFSPSEGGSIGAIGTLILGLLYRRFTWKNFYQALLDAERIISMVFLIVIGAQLFTQFAAWCNLSGVIARAVSHTHASPMLVVFFIELIFFIWGYFLDVLPLILIAVPILHPIVVGLGVDPIWFAILTCVVINVGVLTPPYGLVLFTLKGMAREIPYKTISLGVMPFVFATVVAVAIMWFVPSICTWLPSVMK